MEIRDLDRFNELAESCGNQYLAIRMVTKWSRQLGIRYHDSDITESKLLQWVITGHCPYSESELEYRRIRKDDSTLNEVLEWVQDKEISNEVRDLYRLSVKQHHIVYCIRADFTDSQISRTNILLRMAWFGIDNEEEDMKELDYLGNLVKKSELNREEDVQVTLDAPLQEDVQVSVEFTDDTAEDTTSEVEAAEPSETEVVESVEETEVAEEAKEEIAQPQAADKENLEIHRKINSVIPVKNVRIHNIPDSNSVYRLVTGNVLYKGEVSGFIKVGYMKPGFGIVIGYVEEI